MRSSTVAEVLVLRTPFPLSFLPIVSAYAMFAGVCHLSH
jgi:hypothetical protein